MKPSSLFCLLLLPFFFSCNPNPSKLSNGKLSITHEVTEALGSELVVFNLENKSQGDIALIQPSSMIIEFKDASGWRNMRLLACPCGASCARPQDELVLAANSSHELKWNKKEEWCGDQKIGRRPESFSLDAKKGNYRIKVSYRVAQSEVQSEYYQFKIK